MSLHSKWTLQPGWEDLLRRHGLDSLDRLYAVDTGEVFARSGTTEVRRIALRDDQGTHVLFIKKYWFETLYDRFKGTFRGTLFGLSKVRREGDNLLRLKAWGLDAPRLVAWGEERKGGWLRRSVLVTEGVPNPMSLDVWFLSVFPVLTPTEKRGHLQRLATGLAAAMTRMHRHRFAHRDLFWRNIILSGSSLDRFYLIDSHHGHVWHPWNRSRRQTEDLAALDAVAPLFMSSPQRIRFLLQYLGLRRLTPQTKTFVRRILKCAAPLRERQSRRLPRKAVARSAQAITETQS